MSPLIMKESYSPEQLWTSPYISYDNPDAVFPLEPEGVPSAVIGRGFIPLTSPPLIIILIGVILPGTRTGISLAPSNSALVGLTGISVV